MTEYCRHAIHQRPQLRLQSVRDDWQVIDGQETFQDVSQEDYGANARAKHAYDVGRAEISGAVLSEIDAANSSGDVRRRDRSGQISDEDADYRRHLGRLATHDDAQRVAAKPPRFAEAVVEVANVMLLHQIRIVAKHRDHRWRGLDLRRVIQLDLSARCLRRLPPTNDLFQRRIYLRSADALVPLCVDLEQQLQNLRHTLATQRRREHERDEFQERRLVLRFLLEPGGGVVFLFLEIPFVDDDDQSSAALPCQRSDLEILVVQTFNGVKHEDADIRALNGATRSQRRVELDSLFHLRLASQTGRVDEDYLAAMKDHRRVDCIARRPRFIGDHESVFAEQSVDERGFAHIRSTNDSHT